MSKRPPHDDPAAPALRTPPGAATGALEAAPGRVRSADRALPRARSFDRVTWREIGHLLLDLPLGVFGFVYVVVVLVAGLGLSMTVVGLPLLAAGLSGCRALGRWERSRVRRLLGVAIDPPRRWRRGTLGFFEWLWASLKDPVAWRHALYFFLRLPWGVVTFVLTLVLLVIGGTVLPYVARGLANVDRAMARALLSPSDALERRIAELESDRGTVVDTAAADLRRIERDLHDGAQARLVALAMELGLAKEKLLEDPDEAARMVDAAHGEVKQALQELRDLARGIHPAILTDRGLGPALSAVAGRCTVPVAVSVELPTRPVPAIEGIAYFTVSELLTNVSKHSGARTAGVEVWRAGGRLMLQVRDDGRGGASTGTGSGLAGLAERLDAVDGVLVVDSPAGGPTTVTAELPWRDR
ncbi:MULTISPECIES: sensor histidine kinase [Streptomycetaceae]|uniref:histidine kinase n=1 Tax=Streptantibioticus cattleyicolor (strain ATCC 35852 / DSM 46488 / JCM 4925 / NBRC 14057 / NRRL 8057) TaxID=1003195 RepID=F8K3W9_STREN|nr:MULTISPECIES: sensor domain-containing protein [Streptomycetaceae]AEW95868.1 two-component system sensor kinase [Streptantibioticus cattleyicolor NRRL 8057 = DSM 46488]MYS60409.1 sensor histidine kinase [Streptomyces sp. SID5468]CCB76204.1 putative two-component system sensor kinase [Streptantibioticus cattleyicolor NRRL 8057 = DSM 46488]